MITTITLVTTLMTVSYVNCNKNTAVMYNDSVTYYGIYRYTKELIIIRIIKKR